MNFGKGLMGLIVIVPTLLAACSASTTDENLGSDDEALKVAPGCQPPDPGGKCYAQGIAVPGGVCVSKLDLYSKAEASCKPGQKMRDFAITGLCPGGGANGAKFLCCDTITPPPPPPPPPRKCFAGGFTASYPPGVPCADPKSLPSQVEAICKKAGYDVNSFSVGGACAAGGYDGAKYECCEPKIDPPPPPPPRKCFGGGWVNGAGPGAPPACEDPATLSSKVTSICAASGFVVNTFSVGAPCASGGYNGASYECCEPKDGSVPPTPPPPPPPGEPVDPPVDPKK